MVNHMQYQPPGRLGDPNMTPETDPRVNPVLLEAMKPFGLHLVNIPDGPTKEAPFDEVATFARATDEGIRTLYNTFEYDTPALASTIPVEKFEQYTSEADGHKIKLIIYRPANSMGTPLPAVMYTHGGGMIILDTENHVHLSYMEALARTGIIAIAVDYRNGITPDAHNPFPIGLNDCAAAVQWVHANRQTLGISKIILNGESGGANLAISTALKANKEGWINMIAGVAVAVPYISGAYSMPTEWKLQNLPSLVENDGYFVNCVMMATLIKVYDPTGEHAQNPLAWPYWAKKEDLTGLPPFLIFVNELDPLRDEGCVFYRNLAAAGVRVIPKMNLGAVHAASLLFRYAIPDQFLAEVGEVSTFAQRV